MSCPGTDSPCAIAGDDLYYDVTFSEADGTPIDLTGATAAMDLRESVTSGSVAQAMSGGITVPANGQMRFTLTDTETAALLPRAEASKTFAFSVKITYSDATEETILTGTYTFNQAATA